jgi:hypothetical protein
VLELQVHPKPLNHMNRREFARNVVGAIVGVAVVPQCFDKPKAFAGFDPSFAKGGDCGVISFFMKETSDGPFRLIRTEKSDRSAQIYVYQPARVNFGFKQTVKRFPLEPPPDISIADKLRIRDTLG